MEESHVHDIARVIQLALAPAFLLTAVGSFLNVFANRLVRIVDRTRVLESRAVPGDDASVELEVLQRRGQLVRWSLTLGTGAALLVSLVIGVAFLGFLMQANVSFAVAGLFVTAMAALTLGPFVVGRKADPDSLQTVGRAELKCDRTGRVEGKRIGFHCK